MADMTCLAEGQVFAVDSKVTGVNLNEMIVGTTGSGKSFSVVYPRLLYTNESSLVVPITKKKDIEQFAEIFKKRGYEVIRFDFTKPEDCMMGYDPLDYVKREEDAIKLARNIIGQEPSRSRNGESDPYWNNSGTSVLAAEILLIMLYAKENKERARFVDVIKLHRTLKVNNNSDLFRSNLDILFENASKQFPGNLASEMWKTIGGLGMKTASCILSVVNTAVDKLFTTGVCKLMNKEKRIKFENIGKRKTILFIRTSPISKNTQSFVDLMYADMFRVLFEQAEMNQEGELNIPVHIICDDFACGTQIVDFEQYISVFRAAKISVTILLQSESQLNSMYGDNAAATIINNCDTYVYMGGMDVETCRNISLRVNKPLDKVLGLPLEQVIVFRRGAMPVISRRYQILNDPLYKTLIEKKQNEINK